MVLSLGYDINVHPIQVGIDESGRGTLLGPVFAAAVILDPNIAVHPEINDSKKLSRKKRAKLRSWIEENAMAWSISYRDAAIIDKINILNATQEAMEESLFNVYSKLHLTPPSLCLVDGDRYYGKCPQNVEIMTIEHGDAKYANIAAASILAKEYHDEFIRKLIVDHPELLDYDLESNQGYCTPRHIMAIQKHGYTEFHRSTFSKVKECTRRKS